LNVNCIGYVPNVYANVSSATTTATGKHDTWRGTEFYHFDKRTELHFALTASMQSALVAQRKKMASCFKINMQFGVGALRA
jgi:hypothetical protein